MIAENRFRTAHNIIQHWNMLQVRPIGLRIDGSIKPPVQMKKYPTEKLDTVFADIPARRLINAM